MKKKRMVYLFVFLILLFVITVDAIEIFDIELNLENSKIEEGEDLVSFTIFENFGEVSTEANLTYRILNESGELIHIENAIINVETIKTYYKVFKGFNFTKGEYKLQLTTVYGENVTDIFEANFEVETKIRANLYSIIISMFGLIFILIAVIVFIFSIAKKYRTKRESMISNIRHKVKSGLNDGHFN